MRNNAEVRDHAKKRKVNLWELAIKMNISEPTMTRKLRVELPDADKVAVIALIDEIAVEKAKENAATV